MPPKRYKDTFFTKEQVEILAMRSRGMTLDEIARELGVSKASVHAVLKNALGIVRKARNTLRLYAEITGKVSVTVPAGSGIDEVVNQVFREADLHGIRLPLRSSDVVVTLARSVRECIDFSRSVIRCDVRIVIDPRGVIEVRKE